MSTLKTWTVVFVILTFGLYLGIAWWSRVSDTKGFFIAGGGVPAPANGMATAADWMSAASFISMAGLVSGMGFAGGVYLMGWTGGYVLLALLLAPYLRKFGHFTVPDFIGDRYAPGRPLKPSPEQSEGPDRSLNYARLIALFCAIFVSFTYVVGQMKGVGVVFSGFLGVTPATGVFIGMAIVFVYAVFGGMKGITWTQVAQFWVLITAFLIPAIAISLKLTGQAVPSVGLASPVLESVDPARPYLLDKLSSLNQQFGFGSYTDAYGENAGKWNRLNVFCVCLALMAGTAGLPHVIVRFYTVKSVKAARWSAFWALGFISLLYLTAPSVAAFARYYMVDDIAGLNGKTAEELPQWYHDWNKTGLIAWVDFNGDGKLAFTNNLTNHTLRYDPINDPDFEHPFTTIQHERVEDEFPGITEALKESEKVTNNYVYIHPNELMRIGKVPEAIRKELIESPTGWMMIDGVTGLQEFSDRLLNTEMDGIAGSTPEELATSQAVITEYSLLAKAKLLKLGAAHHPDRDIIVLATPQMAQLADWVVAFVIAGGLAAALSTASGLLLVISSSVAHDLYFKVMNPQASEKQRLLVGRVAIGVAVCIAGYFGINPPGFVGEVVAFAFGLAAASFFPAIVLGIFTKRVGTVPAVAGMLVGITFTAFYIVTQKADVILLNAEVAAAIFGSPDSAIRNPWFFGIDAQGIGTVGMVLNFVVTLALTPFFKGASPEVQALVESVREPEAAPGTPGSVPAPHIENAPAH
ncbi:sodium:solute symporter family protein [Algisphaera agarilytica]|uniref:Putative sodium:solute symporter n=1 Tax=Algisphaera agarilytica TaxID=1385975 RepID=A0A7X0LLL8_9BACT|nr:sodium:solute symporter family protein [Algisphaera agarilytica]MBB6430771.1 putative sodium:solute symporter [Algisphaera agarilytica]